MGGIFLTNKEIRSRADEFRIKNWGEEVPVDVERLIEKLEIDFVPIPGLMKIASSSAFITSDWKCVCVDNDCYNDEKQDQFLRFSLAHELGHFVLHKELYESLDIKDLDSYLYFWENISGDDYNYIEHPAERFAGYLLVPFNKLFEYRKNLLEQKSEEIKLFDNNPSLLNTYLARSLNDKFGIGFKAMKIALDKFDREFIEGVE